MSCSFELSIKKVLYHRDLVIQAMGAAGLGPFGSCADIFESCIWSQFANIDPEVIKPFLCSPF